jgi:hypothetical protein
MPLLLALLVAVQQPAELALSNVTVIDIATGSRAPGSTVLIRGNRISAVGPSASVTIPSGARRVDGGGKFVIPGLWDMHLHLSMTGRSALALLLANGVTGVRDMGGIYARVRPWRDSVARGTIAGPRIFTAGPIVERGNWIRAVRGLGERLKQPGLIAEMDRRLPLDSVSDGPRMVDSLARLGVDFIKIRNFPSPRSTSPLRERRASGDSESRAMGPRRRSSGRFPTPALPASSIRSSISSTAAWSEDSMRCHPPIGRRCSPDSPGTARRSIPR